MAKPVKPVSQYPNMFNFTGDTRTPLQKAEEFLKGHPNAHAYAKDKPGGYVIYHECRNSELQLWEHDVVAEGLTKEQVEKLGVRIEF